MTIRATNISRQLGRAHRDFVKKSEEAVRSIAMQAYRDMVTTAISEAGGAGFGSPVASGRFAASFRVSINGVDTSTAPADPDYQYPSGSGPRSLPPRTIRNQPISRVSAIVRQYKLGDTIYISNSVPYVRKIEIGGHSWQTPGGVFQPTIQRLNLKFRSVRITLNG